MKRLPPLARLLIRPLWRAASRAVVTGLIFVATLLVVSHYLGLPIPSLGDTLERFEGVARLAEVLS